MPLPPPPLPRHPVKTRNGVQRRKNTRRKRKRRKKLENRDEEDQDGDNDEDRDDEADDSDVKRTMKRPRLRVDNDDGFLGHFDVPFFFLVERERKKIHKM